MNLSLILDGLSSREYTAFLNRRSPSNCNSNDSLSLEDPTANGSPFCNMNSISSKTSDIYQPNVCHPETTSERMNSYLDDESEKKEDKSFFKTTPGDIFNINQFNNSREATYENFEQPSTSNVCQSHNNDYFSQPSISRVHVPYRNHSNQHMAMKSEMGTATHQFINNYGPVYNPDYRLNPKNQATRFPIWENNKIRPLNGNASTYTKFETDYNNIGLDPVEEHSWSGSR